MGRQSAEESKGYLFTNIKYHKMAKEKIYAITCTRPTVEKCNTTASSAASDSTCQTGQRNPQQATQRTQNANLAKATHLVKQKPPGDYQHDRQ